MSTGRTTMNGKGCKVRMLTGRKILLGNCVKIVYKNK